MVDILESPPTALEIKTHCQVFDDNMKAMTAAKAAFIKAQNCEKLKLALRSKIRTADHIYQPGDYVYYRREKDDRWLGPGKVMWQDNKVIMIRHGGYCSRVSANRLLPVKEELRQRIEAGEIAGADVEKEVMQEAQASNDTNENTQDDDSSRERGNIVQQPEINNTTTDNTEIQNDENELMRLEYMVIKSSFDLNKWSQT